MSLFTELFGESAIYWRKNRVLEEINKIPPTQKERRSYLLHDWSVIAGVKLSKDDFRAVGV